MLTLKYLLLGGGIAMFVIAAAIAAYDIYMGFRYRRRLLAGQSGLPDPEPARWRTTVALVLMAWAPLLIALSIAVAPRRTAAVRVTQSFQVSSSTFEVPP